MLNAGRDKRISIYQTYFVFVPLFSKPILTRENILSTKNSQEFLALQVSVFRRNEATNSSNSNRPFFSYTESLLLGNLFKVFRLDITFALEVCHLGIKMKKIWQSSYSFPYPQWQKARANVMTKVFQTWINYLIQGFSLQLKMGRLKCWSWWLYFSSRREPSLLKTGRRFS